MFWLPALHMCFIIQVFFTIAIAAWSSPLSEQQLTSGGTYRTSAGRTLQAWPFVGSQSQSTLQACVLFIFKEGVLQNMARTVASISWAYLTVMAAKALSSNLALGTVYRSLKVTYESRQVSYTATERSSRRDALQPRRRPSFTCMSVTDWSSALTHTMAAEPYKRVKQAARTFSFPPPLSRIKIRQEFRRYSLCNCPWQYSWNVFLVPDAQR